jgi:hypothetical protein
LRYARHVAYIGDLRKATRILVGEPELKTLLGRLGCILSSDAIQPELLSVIKYTVNKKEDNFSKKV